MTCSLMGGPCNAQISGNSKEEMMQNGMAHMEQAHPEMAAQVKAMPKDDPQMVAWNEKFNKDWDAAPTV